MLEKGIYEAVVDDTVMSNYRIRIEVKETEKSYVFKMIHYDNRYGPDHFKTLFSENGRARIRKERNFHPMRIWDNTSFTIYPFQAGIPFCFKKVDNKPLELIEDWIDFNRIITRLTKNNRFFDCSDCKYAGLGTLPGNLEHHCIDAARDGSCRFYSKYQDIVNEEIKKSMTKENNHE